MTQSSGYVPEGIHRYSMKILEAHLDSFGHVNNAAYLSILEEARWDLITQNGYGLDRIQETGLGPVILKVVLQFKKELHLRQEISIETRLLTGTWKKVGIIFQEIKDHNKRICANAEFTIGLFNIRTRKLVTPTAEWLKAIGANPQT